MRDQELRDQIAEALCVDHGHSRREGGANCRTCSRRADAVVEVIAPLLWLHAEAVWLGQGAEDALRRECARLRREVEFEANALEAGADYLGFDEPRRASLCEDAASPSVHPGEKP